jgi:hypothetical protein
MIRSICTAICVTLLCGQLTVAQVVYDESFDASDGGYTVENQGNPTGPWTYSAEAGAWYTDGTDNNGAPSHTRLTSPAVAITKDGPVELSFSHFYSIEGELWDGGAVFVSVNSGAFTQVPRGDFTANGYTGIGLIGNHDLNGGVGFNGDSPNYPEPITSVASLGTLSTGDSIALQFLMANDEFASGAFKPNWQIDRVTINQVPEPSTLLLSLFGMLGLFLRRRAV